MSAPAGGDGPHAHVARLERALESLRPDLHRLEAWGKQLAVVLGDGGRLLALGNGGSAAQCQHLTAELVGRYKRDRSGLSALALHSETSSLTAIANDYGIEHLFARQVRAHGRPGDVAIALSTSGRSPNLIAGIEAARDTGMTTWCLTGKEESPLCEVSDECIRVDSTDTATVQEVHLVCIHLLCDSVDHELAPGGGR